MTVNQTRVRTMERATTLLMTTDVTVWQALMEQTVLTVCEIYLVVYCDFYEHKYYILDIFLSPTYTIYVPCNSVTTTVSK